jgi:hypothetical protein
LPGSGLQDAEELNHPYCGTTNVSADRQAVKPVNFVRIFRRPRIIRKYCPQAILLCAIPLNLRSHLNAGRVILQALAQNQTSVKG